MDNLFTSPQSPVNAPWSDLCQSTHRWIRMHARSGGYPRTGTADGGVVPNIGGLSTGNRDLSTVEPTFGAVLAQEIGPGCAEAGWHGTGVRAR